MAIQIFLPLIVLLPNDSASRQPNLTSMEFGLWFVPMNEPGVLEPPPSTRWQRAKAFAEVVNTPDMDCPPPSSVEALVLWLKGAKVYYQAEMGGTPTDQDRQMQKQMLSTLIGMGEVLVKELRQHDITAKADLTLADVEATLEELYVSQRVSFGGMTEARRAQVLDEVFGAS